jgi:hypothetical protein
MEPVVFRYRSRSLGPQDIAFIQRTLVAFYAKGRSHMAKALYEVWGWVQPNGKFKDSPRLVIASGRKGMD